MNATPTSITAIVEAMETASDGRWSIWLSDTGRWWAARTRVLAAEALNAGCVPFLRADNNGELAERMREQDAIDSAIRQDGKERRHVSADDAAIHQADDIPDDLRNESEAHWGITHVIGGYRAVLRDNTGHAPVTLYGRTPGELAESIRMAEGSL